MNVNIGIIGLAKSGRSTIFNALTRGKVAGSHTSATLSPHIGTAQVPEPRLKVLADMFHPRKIVPATVTYIDVGASVKDLVKDKGIGGQFLNQLSNADALINVIRAFNDESLPRLEGSPNIERNIDNMDLELAFADLTVMERRLEKLGVSLKGAKPPERPGLLREQELLLKIKAGLEKDKPIRGQALTDEENKAIANYQFLTAKPLLVVVNIGEEQLPQAESLSTELNSRYSRPKCRFTAVCGKLEMELAELDDSTAQAMRTDFGITEAGADYVIKLSYELLGLISFFTIASSEVKVWPIPEGTDAVNAAAKIHSDMGKGFIRAEVISYGDLIKCGGLPEARKKGLLRLEGKNYIVQDGDVITFLFNV